MIALKARREQRAMSLTELLCVMLIIAILAAFYLGAISEAFAHVKKFLANF
ncbi:MAG: type II secretion system protein [Verrucomicrobiota bacterium]|jgi:prepilin-type N-terminal cleavage/methylation domain-containing protein